MIPVKHWCVSIIFLLASLLIFGTCLAMDFVRPTKTERLRAIGSPKGLSETVARSFDPGNDFDPIPVPGPSDWLAQHPEPGQTFEDFIRSNPSRPDPIRNKIYLQPLGMFQSGQGPPIVLLKAYAALYFAMDVELLPPIAIAGSGLTTRLNPYTQDRQILSSQILALLKTRLPSDAFCLLAVTMEDLYPHPSWNFVFGQASFHDRVGVFSFARYDPKFYGEPRGEEYRQLLLRRSMKVLVHETAHMFGLDHCIFFRCVMNGSNHLKESDSRPLHLCPVCLRKLQFSIGFDVVERYDKLSQFYRKIGFHHEDLWISHRMQMILGDKKGRYHPSP